jgi:hypothetical protein
MATRLTLRGPEHVTQFRRPGLERTLRSVARQRLTDGASAHGMVEVFRAQAAFPVSYAIEPRKGLSSARIACSRWQAAIG